MVIGDRILLARKRAKLSLRALAAAADCVTYQAIYKYETGQDVPGSNVILRLADALGVTVEFLVRPTSLPITSPQFRKLKKVSAKDKGMLEAFAQDIIERRLVAEQIVNGHTGGWSDVLARVSVTNRDEAEQAADECRRAMGLGAGPVGNLTATLEQLGIRIIEPPVVVTGFDGVSSWAAQDIPFIMVSRDPEIPGDRQRLTTAHELGHLIMDCSGVDEDGEEDLAYRFAGAFLVPRQTLLSEIGSTRSTVTWPELSRLKRVFGVSMGALVYRAAQCGLMTEVRRQAMHREWGRAGWKRAEPGAAVPREPVDRMERLLEHALAEGLISESRAAELAGVSLRDFCQRRNEVIAEHVHCD